MAVKGGTSMEKHIAGGSRQWVLGTSEIQTHRCTHMVHATTGWQEECVSELGR